MPRESAAVTGRPASDKEAYPDSDRDAMCRVIRAVDKPVLAFKVLAARRKCDSPDPIAQAFRFAYAHIKPTDAVVVGLFPRDQDETALDLAHAQAACSAAAGG